MRVFITGHLGYVGSVLTPLLQSHGHELFGWESDLYQACSFGPLPHAIPARQADIRDIETDDLVSFDAVIHLAGLSNDPLGDLDPALTHEINYAATAHLAEMAKAAGVQRFIFASTCSVYGAIGDAWVDEASDCAPVTPYAKSKLRAEEALSELADDAFSPVLLRSGTVFGMSPRIRFDLVVNNLTAWAYTTGRVLLKSDGTAWRPLLHVEDMAQAFTAALNAPRMAVHGQVLNVGSTTNNFQVRDIAEMVSDALPSASVEYKADAGEDARSYRVNCDKITSALPGFQPRWRVDQGIEQLLAAYHDIGLSQDDFEGPRYQRLAHLQSLMHDSVVDASLRRLIPA